MEEQYFFNEVQARFHLRKPKANKPTNIYLVCRINGKQVKLSTGVKVYPEHWNEEKQEAYISCRLSELDNRNNTITNEKLTELKASFVEYKYYLCQHPNEMEQGVELLRKFIYKDTMVKKQETENAIHWLRNAIIADKNIGESTRADYIKQIKFFEIFLNETGRCPISFSDINLPLIKGYELYLLNKDVGKGKTTKTTTVGNKVEKIICILKRAEQQGMIDIHESNLDKYKKPRSKEGDSNDIFLTEEEISKIYALELSGKEEQVRDLFVLQCWIGQRFTDTQSINEGIMKDNGNIIEIIQEKTKHKVSVPLLPIAKEILAKYENLFPIFTNQTALNYLTKIGEKAGITRLHTIVEHRGDEVTKKQVPVYKLIKTHTARRSFICNMLLRGFDAHLIMKITGHNDVESFQKYVKLTSNDAANVILENEANQIKSSKKTPITKEIPIANDVPTDIEGILNYVFALDKVNELFPLLMKGIDIYGLDDEINELMSIIKDRKRLPKVLERAKELFCDDTIKEVAINKLLCARPMLEQIGKLKNDVTAYQMFINNLSELGILELNIPKSADVKDYYNELPNMVDVLDKIEL